MWAIKNFVCGPSAAVALWPGPSPGGPQQTATGHWHAATSLQFVVLWWGVMWAVSTQPARSLAGALVAMWP